MRHKNGDQRHNQEHVFHSQFLHVLVQRFLSRADVHDTVFMVSLGSSADRNASCRGYESRQLQDGTALHQLVQLLF